MSDKLCACGHVESFHEPGLGCSGSHSDSMPCTHYAPPWRGADLDAVRRLAKANARSYWDMTGALTALAERANLTADDIDKRMCRDGLARRVQGSYDVLTIDDLRAYATAVGARLTFTVEADPDVEAGA